jgi:hypothetical protein
MKQSKSQLNVKREPALQDSGLADLEAPDTADIKGGPRSINGFIVTFDRPVDPA